MRLSKENLLRILLFIGLLLLPLMANPGHGFEPGGITGMVSLDEATGVKAATIKIKKDDKVLKEVQVESGKEFKILNIPDGKYRFVVEARLHTTFVEDNVYVAADRGVDKKIVILQRRTDPTAGGRFRCLMRAVCYRILHRRDSIRKFHC